MTSSAGSVLSSPAWVGRSRRARPAPARAPAFPVRGGIAGGLVLLAVVWTALWVVFLLGVVAPAAALHAPAPEGARAAPRVQVAVSAPAAPAPGRARSDPGR